MLVLVNLVYTVPGTGTVDVVLRRLRCNVACSRENIIDKDDGVAAFNKSKTNKKRGGTKSNDGGGSVTFPPLI
jgi:hypothetical protein